MKSVSELTALLTACDAAYVERTGKQPVTEAKLYLYQSDEAWEADMWAKRHGPDTHLTGEGATPEAAIADLMRLIAALPSEEERNLSEFQHDLANLIDKGRSLGIDVEYVNPLAATAKKLAENALPKPKAVW